MRTLLPLTALVLGALIHPAVAAPSRYFGHHDPSSNHHLQLLAPRSRDSDPADRNPWGLPHTYEGNKRVFRTDILRETGQQPKWLQEKEAARKRVQNLGLGREEDREGYVHFVGGSPAGRHPQGGSQSTVSAIRDKATSSAKVAINAGKGVVRSAKGALRKGFCFLKNC